MTRLPNSANANTASVGRRTVFVLMAVAAVTAVVIGMGPGWLATDASIKTLFAASLLLVPLCVVLAVAKSKSLDAKETTFRLGLVIWWYLLFSDALFDRISNVQGTYQGQYSVEAYGEFMTWAVAFIALVLISLARLDFVTELFSGSFKWASLFLLSSLVAVTYSPSPAYSVGWWFKLFVIVLTLRLCLSSMDSVERIRAFLWASLWGLLLAVALPLSVALADPLTLFQGVGGRLNVDPVVVSETSSCILIVALTLNATRKHIWLSLILVATVLIMILSAGKTGIFAGFVATVAFFMLQKRVASGLAAMAGIALVALLVITTVTPVGNYFLHYSGGSTLTGRTDIWKMALPGIKQHPLLGHGYLASKFMWVRLTGPFAEVGHLHNGFLEALYNNGLVGLVFLLGMHAAILANLWLAKKTANRLEGKLEFGVFNVLIVGSFCLYLDLLINGMFTVAFGGRPTAHFMMFMGALAWSVALQWIAVRVAQRAPAVGLKSSPVPVPGPTPLRPGRVSSPSLG